MNTIHGVRRNDVANGMELRDVPVRATNMGEKADDSFQTRLKANGSRTYSIGEEGLDAGQVQVSFEHCFGPSSHVFSTSAVSSYPT